jgi:hypothetical protein
MESNKRILFLFSVVEFFIQTTTTTRTTNKHRKKTKKRRANTYLKINVIYFDSLELDREYLRSFFFGDSAVLPLAPVRRPDVGGDCPRR